MKPVCAPVVASVAAASLPLSRLEKSLLCLSLAWLLLALFGPHVAQYADYHAFADQSQHWGLSHWGDVWSNLPLVLVGAVGAGWARRSSLNAVWPALYERQQLFFYGLMLAGMGSFAYHLAPNDQTLWLDRLGMCVAFAGILGVTVTHRCSDRAGQVMTYAALIAGPFSLWLWQYGGSLWAWSAYQGGGMLLIVAMACLPAASKRYGVALAGVMACYGVAKLCELADHQIYALTHGWVSGHTLKHLWSAAAGLPVLLGLKRMSAPAAATKKPPQ